MMVNNKLASWFHDESYIYQKDQNAPSGQGALSQQENTCGKGNEARRWVLDGLKEPACVSTGNIHTPPECKLHSATNLLVLFDVVSTACRTVGGTQHACDE